MTSSFLVFQAQRDLSQARNNELQAIIDYLKSVVDFETAQEVPLGGAGGVTGVTAGFGGGLVTPQQRVGPPGPGVSVSGPSLGDQGPGLSRTA